MMQKWEYTTVGRSDDYLDVLNQHGREGWEVVTVIANAFGSVSAFVLKRQKEE